MTKTVLLATAAVFALTGASYAGTAHHTLKAGISGSVAHQHIFHTHPGSTTLVDENGNASGSGNSSQNFESSFDQYDNQGADDFIVPSGHNWTVKEVDVTGQYRYSGGGAATANVFFYKDKKGLPNEKATVECDNVATGDSSDTGSFALKLGKGCKVKLKAGHYWVSVQANLDFSSPAEQWYWDTNTDPQNDAAAWQDPNGGWTALGVPASCVKWGTLSNCLAGSGDWMFALQGKDKG